MWLLHKEIEAISYMLILDINQKHVGLRMQRNLYSSPKTASNRKDWNKRGDSHVQKKTRRYEEGISKFLDDSGYNLYDS